MSSRLLLDHEVRFQAPSLVRNQGLLPLTGSYPSELNKSAANIRRDLVPH